MGSIGPWGKRARSRLPPEIHDGQLVTVTISRLVLRDQRVGGQVGIKQARGLFSAGHR